MLAWVWVVGGGVWWVVDGVRWLVGCVGWIMGGGWWGGRSFSVLFGSPIEKPPAVGQESLPHPLLKQA